MQNDILTTKKEKNYMKELQVSELSMIQGGAFNFSGGGGKGR
ncbi:hypothetical protein [Rodentibacter caecimuris]|nr:hypothetical protein [Rodentibacter heylii]MCX2962296.1 hypothetical protein [Rodentibacter heylii]